MIQRTHFCPSAFTRSTARLPAVRRVSRALSLSVAVGCALGCRPATLDLAPPPPLSSCAAESGELDQPILGPAILARRPSFAGIAQPDAVSSKAPVPPLSGGTLLVSRDGARAWVADADRDVVYRFDLAAWRTTATVAFEPGSWPGRLTEDDEGRVHVVLRGAGTVATLDPETSGSVLFYRSPCAQPRGIAYEHRTGLIHVACGEGTLVSYLAAATEPRRLIALPTRDLRDVVVDGDALAVSTFHSARVWWLGADGSVLASASPPDVDNAFLGSGFGLATGVAWRMTARPAGGVVLAHQRGRTGLVSIGVGGYGSGGTACDALTRSVVSVLSRDEVALVAPDLPSFTLPVDVAVSADGQTLAVLGAGQAHMPDVSNVFVGPLVAATDERKAENDCAADGWAGPAPTPLLRCCAGSVCTASAVFVDAASMSMGGSGGLPLLPAATPDGGTVDASGDGGRNSVTCGLSVRTEGEPVALAFWGTDSVLVQSREPAGLSRITVGQARRPFFTVLSQESRSDVGFAIFHSDSGSGVACASCHPEGREDGRDWAFDCEGTRRTQDLAAGVRGTEPFNWSGDVPSFKALLRDVFQRRMSGPELDDSEQAGLLSWLSSQRPPPALRVVGDPSSAAGRLLFEDSSVGCASCHAGASFTNNDTVDVGTGGAFQVPSLRGVSTRPPYLHNGCASTLAERFSKVGCGGGEKHGHTAALSSEQVANLVAYLETL